jgi:uncharacterized protein with ParB-like and HNH nuclease domain
MKALIKKSKDIHGSDRKEVHSGILTLEEIVQQNIHFNIPIYQRLYVWKSDQIQMLVEDIKASYLNDSKDYFYLGSVILTHNAKEKTDNTTEKTDLVDGQQRFTTLWLLCDLLSEYYPELKNYTYINGEPRVFFSIRDKAQSYLKNKDSFQKYLNEKGEIMPGTDTDVSEIVPLINGRNILISLIESLRIDKEFSLENFSRYIFTQVTFTFTVLPDASDMNRVFEAMNNRGKQLEHHQLLKSKLLKKLNDDDKLVYAQLWDACSDMNTYFEKSIKDIARLTWKNLFSHENIKDEFDEEHSKKQEQHNLVNVDLTKFLNRHNHSDEIKKTLLEILQKTDHKNTEHREDKIEESDFSSKQVRSIITFPAFLLHVLRIYQINKYGRYSDSAEVNDKKLIEQFQVKKHFKDEGSVKYYIELLWKARVLFDRYIIKWVYDEASKEEYHDIEHLQISTSYVYTKKGDIIPNVSAQRVGQTDSQLKVLIMLQGMLYHSQEMTTQYWLTPFLHYLMHNSYTNETLVRQLEILENELFHSNSLNGKLKDRTFDIIFKEDLLQDIVNSENYLESYLGTDYPNYIFYKVEYILWKNRVKLCNKHQLDIDKWNKYRLTAKNSVEHIFPQHSKQDNLHIHYMPESEELIKEGIEPLDDFGNLVLLSPGMNSEYSNKPYKEKRGQFLSKAYVDSLKSDLIFKNDDWNWNKVQIHRNEIIQLLNEYIADLRKFS